MQNYLWTICYYVGLQFTHLDFLPTMNKFVLANQSDRNSSWPWYFWLIIGGIVTAAGGLLVYMVYLWHLSGPIILSCYISYILLLAAIISILTYVYVKSFHMHHYFNFLLLASVCGHHNVLVVVLSGIACGCYVEGCARWSMAPEWKFKEEYLNNDITSLKSLYSWPSLKQSYHIIQKT